MNAEELWSTLAEGVALALRQRGMCVASSDEVKNAAQARRDLSRLLNASDDASWATIVFGVVDRVRQRHGVEELTTVIDEEFGLQPVAPGETIVDCVHRLERLLSERRRTGHAERDEAEARSDQKGSDAKPLKWDWPATPTIGAIDEIVANVNALDERLRKLEAGR